MRRGNCGPKNGFWKGGRTVASNGYVLIRLPGHPLADCRGYVYEHRLIAERKIGRPLKRGEHVHHIDGNKQNNVEENLEVMASAAHHRVRHRKRARALRMPGEPNPVITCACGCGDLFRRFDEAGRPRRYISGHNPHPATTCDAIISALREGARSRANLARMLNLSYCAVGVALSKMKRQGLIVNGEHGLWFPVGETDGR